MATGCFLCRADADAATQRTAARAKHARPGVYHVQTPGPDTR
jgi:hypothetical protein